MKRICLFILPLLAGMALSSCDVREQEPVLRTDGARESVFRVMSEQTTRTYVDGLSVLWDAADELALFDDAGSDKSILTLQSGAGTKSAVFKGTVSSAATEFFAAYPASSASAVNSGVLTITVPAEQKLVSGGRNLDPSALVGVAAGSGGELAFKNVIAAIRFNVDMDNIVSVSLKGNGGEALAGTVKVNAHDGVVAEVEDPAFEVVLTPSGEAFEPGQYVFTLLPGEFPQGVTLSFTDKAGNVTERCNVTDLTIARGRLLDLAAFIKLYDISLSFQPGETREIRIMSQGVSGLAAESIPEGWTLDASSLQSGTVKISAPAAGTGVPAGVIDFKGTSAAGNAIVSDDLTIRLYGVNSKQEFLAFRSLYQGDDEDDNAALNNPVVDPAVIGDYLVDGALLLNADLAFETGDMLKRAYILKYLNVPIDGNGHGISLNFEGTAVLCSFLQYIGADVSNLTISGSASLSNSGEGRLASLAASVSPGKSVKLENVVSTVALSSAGRISELGGLVAYANQGSLGIEGCSFDGSVSYNPSDVAASPAFGGLVGRVNTSVTIKDSGVQAPFDIVLDNRRLCTDAGSGLGGIIGVTTDGQTVTLDNVTNKAAISVKGVSAGEERSRFAQIIGNNLSGTDLSSCHEEGSVTFEDYVGPEVVFVRTDKVSFVYGGSERYDFSVENLKGATLVSASVDEVPAGWTLDLSHATDAEPYVTVTAPSQDAIKAGTAAAEGVIVITVKTSKDEEGTNVVKPAVRLYGINNIEDANVFATLYDKNVKTTDSATRDLEQAEKAAQYVPEYMQGGKIVFNSDINLGSRTNFFLHWVQNPIEGNNRTLTLNVSGTSGVVAFCQHLVCPVSNLRLSGSASFSGGRTTVCSVASLAGSVRTPITINNVHSDMTLRYQPNNVSTRNDTPSNSLFLVGGIAASQVNNMKVTFKDCSYSGNMQIDWRVRCVGGIIAQGGGSGTYDLTAPIDNHGMTIVDGCSFSGNINVNTKVKSVSNYTTVGGLIGEVSRNCKVLGSVSSGKITVDAISVNGDQAEFVAPVGGLVGRMSNVCLLEISDSSTADSMEITVRNLHNTAQDAATAQNNINKVVGFKYDPYITLNNVTVGGSVKLSWYKDLLDPIEY